MTLEQLRIFVAVAEREHVTRAAQALNLTQSAVSGAVAAMEDQHQVKLFDRVGRGVVLNDAGRMFLDEARGVLARAGAATQMLAEIGGLARGTLRIVASQTIAGYWLPPLLAEFRRRHPGIRVVAAIANTRDAARQVHDGAAELGFVEGPVDDRALARWTVAEDRLMLVARDAPERVDATWLKRARWVVREEGSGTRAIFEQAIHAAGVDPATLDIALELPSNEAVRTAVGHGAGVTMLSALVVAESLAAGTLRALPFDAVARPFYGLRHKERYRTRAADALYDLARECA
ncbi:MAG: LysR substrate-binding domain-containing protein [Pseudomonadota bacterium]